MNTETLIAIGAGIFMVGSLLVELRKAYLKNQELIGYINELLTEQAMKDDESLKANGARMVVTKSGAVEFANEWLSAMPPDTVRDFVVKFDDWKEEDWTMWVRLPWGKYRENKAEIDFAVGRNVMKEEGEV